MSVKLMIRRAGSLLFGTSTTVGTTAGAADAGKIPHLNDAGMIDVSVGMITTSVGVPVDYTDGSPPATAEGLAPKGAICIDTTNANLYVNVGTLAHQAWKLVTRAA